MGSKNSICEEDKRTIPQNKENENQMRNKRKSRNTLLKCCAQDIAVCSGNTSSDFDMDPKVKKSRIISQLSTGSTQSNCNIFTNKLSIQRLRQSERGSYLAAFFRLFDDDHIQDFLWLDRCCMLCDKYLLAMVYAYFRRASISLKEYTRMQFFVALYLAHEMEEDDEDMKMEIYPWALGTENWRRKIGCFLQKRNTLLRKLKYRAVVSKQTCDEIFSLFPTHPVWQRERRSDHGGGFRYDNDSNNDSFFSPSKNQMKCRICGNNDESYSFTSGYFSNGSANTFIQESSISKGEDQSRIRLYDSDDSLLFSEE